MLYKTILKKIFATLIFKLIFINYLYAKNTAAIVDLAGFEYDYTNNIYTTKIDALQRLFGFNRGYDYMSTAMSMVIDAEPIPFKFENKWYMIELWKGQYYSSTGGEIGFYKKSSVDGHWLSVNDEEMLEMSFTLKRNNIEVFSLGKKHWWVTGFKPGLFSEPYQLSLEDIEIQFKDAGMGKAFYNALLYYFTPVLAKLEYKVSFLKPNTVRFRWHHPFMPQYHTEARKYYQYLNKICADTLFKIMHPDYSPESFDQKLDMLKYHLRFTSIDVDNIHGFQQPEEALVQ